jgi:hypothetical protein
VAELVDAAPEALVPFIPSADATPVTGRAGAKTPPQKKTDPARVRSPAKARSPVRDEIVDPGSR